MNANGSGQIEVTDASSPTWSPDGTKIAFMRSTDHYEDDLWMMNADGSGQVELGDFDLDCFSFTSCFDDARPVWSLAGETIALQSRRVTCHPDEELPDQISCNYGLWDIFINDASGPRRGSFTNTPSVSELLGDMSPDGSKILFGDGSDLFMINSDMSGRTNLTSTPGDSAGDSDWSSDGSRIAYVDGRDIWAMQADGTGKVNLTQTPGVDEDLGGWSPDVQKLSFTALPTGSTDVGESEIYVMSADGSGRTRLTDNAFFDLNPDWQPLRALNPFPRPGGATPLRVPLVPSYQQCTAPNSQHVPPLDEPSCTPPALTSQVLTTSSIGKGQGSARLDAMLGNSATPADEADVRIIARAYDVRCATTNSACPGGAGSDFTGRLLLSSSIRLTDRNSGFGGVSATVSDAKLQAPLDCSATADTTLGSSCAATTTADSLIPGFVTEEKRSVISTFSLTLDDPGPNGSGYGPSCPPTCGDGDEAPYLTQGVFTGL